jgi:hygromycin-B 7''-O-kinase
MSTLDAFTREYSKRLGVLTGAQLQAALERFDLGQLLSATPVQAGFSGQNVFLTTPKGEYVLRGRPHYDWQFKRERFFSRVIREETDVPTAWPYLIEPSGDIFGWSFAIMPRLPGIRSTAPEAEGGPSVADATAVANALGTGLARLHRATRPEPAVYDPAIDALRPRSGEPDPLPMWSWWGFLKSMREFLAECVRSGVISVDDGSWALAILDGNAATLDVPFIPTLVHHDYKESNVVLGRGENGWRVDGVFDLAEAYFGDPEEDLARPVLDYISPSLGKDARPHQPEKAHEFLRAYYQARRPRAGFRERFQLYMLRDCLLIWEWLHQRPDSTAYTASFREWAEPCVSFTLP